jgi:predicted NBD/HSP70 family sugar kinase
MFGMRKKEFNTYLLLNLIYRSGAISRTRLAEITDMRAATVSDITKELLDKGIIKEEGSMNTGRGRNQTLIKMNDNFLCALGISIEVNTIIIIIGTLQGKILKTVKESIRKYSSAEQITTLIIENIRKLLDEFKHMKILGIGIGDPGIVDEKGEFSIFSSTMGYWKNVQLKPLIEKEFGLAVRLESNERLKALGEKKYGLAKEINDFVYLKLGDGIGISIISNGEVVRGFNGSSGELGHIHIENNNNICLCGSYGCLETVASMQSIVFQVKKALNNGVMSVIHEYCKDLDNLSFDDIEKALKLNDKLCMNIVEKAGNYIGVALANVVNILNPKMIVFDCEMKKFLEVILEPIKSNVYRNALRHATLKIEFKVTQLEELSSPLGAITIIFEELLMTSYFDKLFYFDNVKYDDNGRTKLMPLI